MVIRNDASSVISFTCRVGSLKTEVRSKRYLTNFCINLPALADINRIPKKIDENAVYYISILVL